jgi:feruloyl esterase
LWLPTADWNGKFMAMGNGGFGGSIQGFGEMQNALRLGYATAGNDTGHNEGDGPNGMFALGHPEKIVDFAYRAMHEMTATSKKLIDKYYGAAPQFSYYKGCSTGGRQGAMNAQRYPDDFDGIIAGALANRHIQMHTAGVYRSIELARHPEAAIPPATAEFVSKAILDKCDTMKDGFLNNPRACSFDFKTLACHGADTNTCLTAPQLKTVEQFYGGVKNSKGELIFSGQALGNPLPGMRALRALPGGRLGAPNDQLIPDRALSSAGSAEAGRRSTSTATCPSSTARSASWTPWIRTCRSSRRTEASSCSTPAGATRASRPRTRCSTTTT